MTPITRSLGARQTLVVAVAVVLLGLETYILFFDRDGAFTIEGKNNYEISEFTNGAVVSHAFLMDRDGLHSVQVRLNSNVPAAVTIQWVLWTGAPETPAQMARAFDGVTSFDVPAGASWQSIQFSRHGSSNNRWFTIELRVLNVAAASNAGGAPSISLSASRDNPRRGGALWVNGARQPGSLSLRAAFTGRTLYRRFQIEATPHMPRLLQLPLVQWTAFVLLNCAFLVFAYSVMMDAEGSS